MLDTRCRELRTHVLEIGVFPRAEVIHLDTHLDSTADSSLHRGKDALGLLVTAQRKVLDVDILLSIVDVLGDTLKDGIVVGEQLDGVSRKGGHAAEIPVELDVRSVTRRDRRVEQRYQLRLLLELLHNLVKQLIHGVLLRAAAPGQLGAPQHEEENQSQIGQQEDQEQPSGGR